MTQDDVNLNYCSAFFPKSATCISVGLDENDTVCTLRALALYMLANILGC